FGSAAAALGRCGGCGCFCDLPWSRARRRAPRERRRGRLLRRIRRRDRTSASHRDRVRTDGAMAGGPHRRARRRSSYRLCRYCVPVAPYMNVRAPLFLTTAFLWPLDAASAHAPFEGGGGFYGGVLHPLFVPAHLLAILGTGLLVGQQVPRQPWTAAAS